MDNKEGRKQGSRSLPFSVYYFRICRIIIGGRPINASNKRRRQGDESVGFNFEGMPIQGEYTALHISSTLLGPRVSSAALMAVNRCSCCVET